MHRPDKEKWPEEFEPESRRSRPGSRRNSTSRRNSVKAKIHLDESQHSTPKGQHDEENKCVNSTPRRYCDESQHSTPKKQREESQKSAASTPKRHDNTQYSLSANSTPKRTRNDDELSNNKTSRSTSKRYDTTPKKTPVQHADLFVTGKQILKKTNRANSLPSSQRRASTDSSSSQKKSGSNAKSKNKEIERKNSTSSKSRETSLEDDMSLDLSLVSDFEDNQSKYGLPKKIGMATSTPKICPKPYQKPRSGSLQSQNSQILQQPTKCLKSNDSLSQRSTFTSRDSLYKTSSTGSAGRFTGRSTELEYSSVSPEYSSDTSCDMSPRTSVVNSDVAVVSPYSQRSQLSGSSCYLSWVETADAEVTKVSEIKRGEKGEWNHFWVNYNNSLSRVPIKNYYDQCPTPYRTEDIRFEDLDLNESQTSKNDDLVNEVIRNEGLTLTPRETQNIIKCAHILGNVLSKAIDRKVKDVKIDSKVKQNKIQDTEEAELKKRNLKLDLKEQNKPLDVPKTETATTQTDISLPNTKSAPKIFENILRQLSKSSFEDLPNTHKKDGDKLDVVTQKGSNLH